MEWDDVAENWARISGERITGERCRQIVRDAQRKIVELLG